MPGSSSTELPEVTVRVPGLLARFTDDTREVPVRAGTLAGAIDGLFEAHPALEPHVLDGHGAVREHVILFVDGVRVEWAERERVGLEAGSTVTVMQAVSGGS